MRSRSTIVLALVVALVLPALAAGAAPGPKAEKGKVEVCHVPPGNPDNAHTITVSKNALKAHLAHDDTEGKCEEQPAGVDDDDDKTSENRAPIARAGADRCVVFGASYELDGTDSYDPDGAYGDLEFDWDVIDRPNGSGLDDGDLFSSGQFDDDPRFEPDRLGSYRFALTVEDQDGASDTDVVDVDVYVEVDLDDTGYEVVEDETVEVVISLRDEAPEDVDVSLSVADDDVVVFLRNSDDDKTQKITKVTIDEGEDEVEVYLYGLKANESTDITVSVGCGEGDTASVDVEEAVNTEAFATTQSVQFATTQRLQLFVIRLLAFTIV